MSELEYTQKAIDFLTKPRGEYGIAHVSKRGIVIRYDYQTCEFAMATAAGKVITYFSPAHNKSAEYADKYYERCVHENA